MAGYGYFHGQVKKLGTASYECTDGSRWDHRYTAVARQRALNLQDVLKHIPQIMDPVNPMCPRAFDVEYAMKALVR